MKMILFVGLTLFALTAFPAVSASEQSCAMDVGAPGLAINSAVKIGGCLVGTIGEAAVVGSTFVSNEEFCSLSADTNNDVQTDTDVEVGTELPAGSLVWMFCTIGIDEYGTVGLSSGTWES